MFAFPNKAAGLEQERREALNLQDIRMHTTKHAGVGNLPLESDFKVNGTFPNKLSNNLVKYIPTYWKRGTKVCITSVIIMQELLCTVFCYTHQ